MHAYTQNLYEVSFILKHTELDKQMKIQNMLLDRNTCYQQDVWLC